MGGSKGFSTTLAGEAREREQGGGEAARASVRDLGICELVRNRNTNTKTGVVFWGGAEASPPQPPPNTYI